MTLLLETDNEQRNRIAVLVNGFVVAFREDDRDLLLRLALELADECAVLAEMPDEDTPWPDDEPTPPTPEPGDAAIQRALQLLALHGRGDEARAIDARLAELERLASELAQAAEIIGRIAPIRALNVSPAAREWIERHRERRSSGEDGA